MRTRGWLVAATLLAAALSLSVAPAPTSAAPILGTGSLALVAEPWLPQPTPVTGGVSPALVAVGPSGAVTFRSDDGEVTIAPTSGTQLTAGASTGQSGSVTGSAFIIRNPPCQPKFRLTITAASYSSGVLQQLAGSFEIRGCYSAVTLGSFAYPSAPLGTMLVPSTGVDLTSAGFIHGAQRDVVLQNPGDGPTGQLTASLAGYYGDNTPTGEAPPEFSIADDGCTGHAIPAHSSCTITVEYVPTSKAWREAELYVADANLPADSYLRLRVSGWSRPNGYGQVFPVERSTVFDTRTSVGRVANTAPLTAAVSEAFSVAGHAGVPASGVLGVVLDVTTHSPSGPGALTVGRTAVSPSTTSSMTFTAGAPTNQQVITEVSDAGQVVVTSSVGTHVQVDVVGWIGSDLTPPIGLGFGVGGGVFSTLDGDNMDAKGAVGTTTRRALATFSPDHVATWARVRILLTGATADGVLKVWPDGTPEPTAPTARYAKGQGRVVTTLVRTDTEGVVALRASAGTVHVEASVEPLAPMPLGGQQWRGRLVPAGTPQRVLDTGAVRLAANKDAVFDVGTIPLPIPDISPYAFMAVELATAVAPSAAGTLRLQGSVVAPLTAGQTASGLIIDPYDSQRSFLVERASAGVRLDVVGWVTRNEGAVTDSTEVTPSPGPPPEEPLSSVVDGPAEAATVLGPGTVTFFDDQFGQEDVPPPDGLTTWVVAATVQRNDDQSIDFRGADGSSLFVLRTGPDGLIAPGTYLTTDGSAADEGGCGAVIVDVAEFAVDGTPLHLAGRSDCGQFRYPTTEPQPTLQTHVDTDVFAASGFFSGKSAALTLSNAGTADLDIGGVTLTLDDVDSGAFTVADDDCSSTTLAPGGSCIVTIHHQPGDDLDPLRFDRATVAITTNADRPSGADPTTRPYTLRLVGRGSMNNLGRLSLTALTRVFDTTTGLGRPGALTTPLTAGSPTVLTVGGANGVPAGAIGVLARAFATGTGTPGSLTVLRHGATPSAGSSLVFPKQGTVSQVIFVPLDGQGRADLRVSVGVHLQLDVLGYVGTDTDTTTGSLAATPEVTKRVVDSARGRGIRRGALKNGKPVEASWVTITSGPAYALVNVTLVTPSANVSLRIWKVGTPRPTLPTMTAPARVTRSSLVLVPTGDHMNVEITGGTAQITVDTAVALSPGGLGRFAVFDAPRRGIDTAAPPPLKLATKKLHVWGWSGLEVDTGLHLSGLIGNLAVTDTGKTGALSLFAYGVDVLPTGTSIATTKSAVTSNTVAVGLGNGLHWVYNTGGAAFYTYDVTAMIYTGFLPTAN